jgi:hypothetical protein
MRPEVRSLQSQRSTFAESFSLLSDLISYSGVDATGKAVNSVEETLGLIVAGQQRLSKGAFCFEAFVDTIHRLTDAWCSCFCARFHMSAAHR